MPLLLYVHDGRRQGGASQQRILSPRNIQYRRQKLLHLPSTHGPRALGSRSDETRMSGEMYSRAWLKVRDAFQESCRWERRSPLDRGTMVHMDEFYFAVKDIHQRQHELPLSLSDEVVGTAQPAEVAGHLRRPCRQFARTWRSVQTSLAVSSVLAPKNI